MDRLIYTAMTGAKHIMEQQANTANNLANVTTTGFRAQIDAFRAIPVVSESLPTRTYVVDSSVGTDFHQGPLQHTGRALDAAIEGPGWLTVQLPDGSEAYTRKGNLKTNENGLLQTADGLSVMGDAGPLSIPPDVDVAIGRDGTLSTTERAGKPGQASVIGRMKLVNPDPAAMLRGDDGLFHLTGAAAAEADPAVRVTGGSLEGSNVNAVEAMVNMINLGRQFELQMNLLKNAESNASKADQLLSLN